MDKQRWYEFAPFRLDAEQRRLFRGEQIVALSPKATDLLIVLVERHGTLITYDELKCLAWTESRFVEDKTLTQTVYTLRTLLGDSSTAQKYIENVPKRGYRFVAAVASPTAIEEKETVPAEAEDPPDNPHNITAPNKLIGRKGILIAVAAALVVSGLIAGLYLINSSRPAPAASFPRGTALEAVHAPSDEAAVRRLVEESQKYESLTIYANPTAFDEPHLPDYWLAPELGGKEILKINSSLRRLQEKGLHYGRESRSERFDIRYVRVFSPRDYAEVGTTERWFLPLYRADGSRVEGRNEYLGTYDVDYALRKVDNRWLIEETSTPRYEDKK